MVKTRISEIDALRGIACLLVILHHFGKLGLQNSFGSNMGWMGVDLFFIISGLVISLTIKSNTSWNYFLRNRFSRLFPTYWVCLIISTLSIIVFYNFLNDPFLNENPPGYSLLKLFLANFTMIQYYLDFGNIDGSYWTLIVELLFYVFILLFLLFKKKHLIELVGGICLVFPLTMGILFYEPSVAEYSLKANGLVPLIAYFPLFYSGIILYKIKFHGKTMTRWAVLFFCFCLQLFLYGKFYGEFNYSLTQFTEYALLLALIYLTFVFYIFDKLKIIANKYTVFIGNISYCVYLLHQTLGFHILMPFMHEHLLINFWISGALTLSIVFLLSYLVHKYIETPSILYLRSKSLAKIESSTNMNFK
jgi:peptidoglycan/LPS O-acetylase OafA/YrhL